MDLENNCMAPASVPDDEETKNFPISENSGIIAGGSKVEANGSPSPARKGHGLKKWRRVKRDSNVSKGGNNSDDTGAKAVIDDLSNLVTNPSKRAQLFSERPQKSEGSVSSPNPVFAVGPLSVDAGTGSENSQDFSSKLSTANVQKTRSLRGKNVTQLAPGVGQQGKGLVFESTKKARGVRIEKENSRWSTESDLRSLNLSFRKGTNRMSNGAQSEGCENGGHEEYGENSADYIGGGLSWEADKGRTENHDNSSEEDPLVESNLLLQKAQDALEEEVLKYKELGKDTPIDGSVSDTHPDHTDEEDTMFQEFPSGECLQSELVEITKRDMEAELENLFKQRIEAEVEYLIISRTVQKPIIGVASVNESIISEEQKPTDSELTENKLGDNKNAMVLGKTDEKLRNLREEIASVGETMKIQKRVCKYTLYFVVQLLIIFGVFIFGLSSNYVEVVPT